MFYLGRFLQIVGLGLTLIACLIGFDQKTSEGTMWAFALPGVILFGIGHWIIPKR